MGRSFKPVIFLCFFCTFVKPIQPADILSILKHRGGNMGTVEPFLSPSQPLLISSSRWLWAEVSNLLCFLCFFYTFVISILILSCQSTINLLFIIHLEFWAWFSIINISKELKGRFKLFSHFQPLSQKSPRHFGNSTGESSSWNKRSHVSEDAKLVKRWCFSNQLVLPRETVWCFAVQEKQGEVDLKKVLSLALWAIGGAPNDVAKSL